MNEGTQNISLPLNVSAENIKVSGENKLPEQMGSEGLLVEYLEMRLHRPPRGTWLILGVCFLSLASCLEFLYFTLPWLSTEMSFKSRRKKTDSLNLTLQLTLN